MYVYSLSKRNIEIVNSLLTDIWLNSINFVLIVSIVY